MKRSVADDSESSYHTNRLHLNTSSSASNVSVVENECRSEVWRCMSGIMEEGVKHITRPMDMIG